MSGVANLNRDAAACPSPLTGGGDGDMIIRHAHPDDMQALVDMGRAFFRESGHETRGLAFDPNSFAHTVALLGRNGVMLAVERFGQVVGMGAVDIAPAFWNHSVTLAQEVFFYLRPEHRIGRGGRLLRALELVAAAKGASVFSAIAEQGPRATALGRLYQAAGYVRAEAHYRKRLDGDARAIGTRGTVQ